MGTHGVLRRCACQVATVVTVTLSSDERAVSAAVGGDFLAALERLLADPETLLL